MHVSTGGRWKTREKRNQKRWRNDDQINKGFAKTSLPAEHLVVHMYAIGHFLWVFMLPYI